jgi:hypothetical protein
MSTSSRPVTPAPHGLIHPLPTSAPSNRISARDDSRKVRAVLSVLVGMVVVAIVYERLADCLSETSSMKINWLWDSELMMGVAIVNGACTDIGI